MDIKESAGSSFARKRICIKTNAAASILETFKVIFKGKTFMVRAKELFTWTPCFLEYNESECAFDDELPHYKSAHSDQDNELSVKDFDDEGVADTYFGDNSLNDHEATQLSEDPFGFYKILKKPPVNNVRESDSSLTHPPSYTPEPSHQETHKEPLSIFKKDGATVSDNFIALYGTWLPSNTKILFVDCAKNSLIDSLVTIDKELDMGINSDDTLLRRLELSRKLLDLKQSDTKDVAQKAKPMNAPEFNLYYKGLVLTPDQVEDLDRNITNEDIKAAVWACGVNKSPCPDGYTFEFFRRYWDIIGSDFCAAVDWFFVSGSFPRGCNASFIALIPKVTDAKFVTDFRPISLIGCVYNVITKILANRLSLVISDLVSNTQSAFIKNRQILDGPFILNEALAWCKRRKVQALIFKEDFAKAYDSVRWDFLLDFLQSFGFGSRWCSWIRGILSSNMASILVNGSPTVEFPILCGLKQGDPLAPLLFILVMKSLHMSISRAVNDGVFKGKWSDDNLANLIRMLQCFQLASGLKINVHKSQVMGVGVHPDIFFIGADSAEKKITWIAWDKVLASKKQGGLGVSSFYALNRPLLLKWVWRFLSQDGSLWSQIISAFYGPSFEDNVLKRSSCWSSILREVQSLALKGLDFFSHIKIRVGNGLNTRFWRDTWLVDPPLCTRFPRMYALERNKEISVAAKWGDPSFDHSFRRQVREGAESQQWADLLSVLGTFSLSPSIDRWVCDLNGDGSFRVKDFRSVLDDLILPSSNMATRWVKYVPVKVNVFAKYVVGGISVGFIFRRSSSGTLERNKEILVAAKWGDPSFDHSFRRQVRDGTESQQWADLLLLLGTFSLSPSIDRWVCDLNEDGSWVKCVPVKVNVFAWRARLERLPTRDNLAKRGVHTDSNLCPIYIAFLEVTPEGFGYSFGYEAKRNNHSNSYNNSYHTSIKAAPFETLYGHESLVIPLDEIQVDDTLHFVEEHVEIMDREVKRLKQSRISIIKRWKSTAPLLAISVTDLEQRMD
nr:RNA-directed DNA polymerase, eukaryota [Tanacetum cinerariifolium]